MLGVCAELNGKRRDFYNIIFHQQLSTLYNVIFYIIDIIICFKLFKRNPERKSVILKTRAIQRGGGGGYYYTWCDNS
jgi:hypothetical protein